MTLPALTPRFRFTIRAIILLMTAIALFLGYHINWIHQRREVLEAGVVESFSNPFEDDEPIVDPPGLLGLFGESGYSNLWLKDVTEDQLRRTRALFPEAEIVYGGQGSEDDPFKGVEP